MKSLSLTLIFALLLSVGARAENIEIALQDDLGGILSGYCIDIKGGNQNIDIANGLQAHTCYSYRGALGSNQTFDSDRIADSQLYMPEYEVCAQLSGLEAGASVGLEECTNTALQKIALTADGRLSPVDASDMCLTAGEETRFGRGGTSQHQIKNLTLEACDDNAQSRQLWYARSAAEG